LAATDRSRARYADLAEGRGAGLVGREKRGGVYRLVSKSFSRGRGEYWRQVSSRYYGNFERAGGQEAHDVVKIAAVVHALDPAWIDGNRPRHRHEDDHQGHQEPDQSSRTLHRRSYPYFPVLGSVNLHDLCVVPVRLFADSPAWFAAPRFRKSRDLDWTDHLDEDPFRPNGAPAPRTPLLSCAASPEAATGTTTPVSVSTYEDEVGTSMPVSSRCIRCSTAPRTLPISDATHWHSPNDTASTADAR